MRTMRSTLSIMLILYICVSLSGAPFVLTASAKITPKKVNEPTKFYTIRKGDTLWKLAKDYLNDPLLWTEFKKYNHFTNPNLIYPLEELQINENWPLPNAFRLPESTARQVETTLVSSVSPDEFNKAIAELEAKLAGKATAGDVQALARQIEELQKKLQELSDELAKLQAAQARNTEAINTLRETQATKEEIRELTRQINTLQSELTRLEAKDYDQNFDDLNNRVDLLASEIAAIKKSIADLEAKLLKPEESRPDDPSSKRKFAIAAAVVGAAAWFAVNALGRGD